MHLRINASAYLCFREYECANDARWAVGRRETKQEQGKKKARTESVNIMLAPILGLAALCLHGAHILSGEVLSSLVWPDLFTLQARLLFSNTYQNIYSLRACLSAPSTNLHHILYPSTSVPSPSFADCIYYSDLHPYA